MSGTPLPPALQLTHGPVMAIDLALFAASSGDHNPLHLDAAVARAAGFDHPVVHGMLTMAFVARLFTRHFGASSVRALNTRFVGVALLGDTIELSATLVDTTNDVARYDLSARTTGGTELVTGQARIATAGTQWPA